MYLKRMELQGFKSFPDKTRLEFNKGITAVVGPNGSGKSNISDALRWVLGEKSAKSLRGAKMEDVIFNGTANRKPMSFAEVSMTLDNSDNALKLDYNEVTVTRRIYRTGEGEYYINGSKCRAKDILELFMDTGIGKEGYSIIGQGRIAEILSTKSEDRRLIFEEAAGIIKYRARCDEAAAKLEKERENLERVREDIAYLEERLGPLKEQSEKAKKARQISEKLKIIDINRFVTEVDKYEAEKKKLDEIISITSCDASSERKRAEAIEGRLNDLKATLSDIEERERENNNLLIDNNTQTEQTRAGITINENNIANTRGNSDKINADKERYSKEITDNNTEIENIGNERKSLESSVLQKEKEYDRKNSEFTGITASMSDTEGKVASFNKVIIDTMSKANSLQSEIGRATAIAEQYEQRRESSEQSFKELNEQREERASQLKSTKETLSLLSDSSQRHRKRLSENKDRLLKIKEETDALNKRLSETDEQIKTTKARYSALIELEKNHEGYYGGVKAVLTERDSNRLQGINGALGELISMDKSYETAIEIALGGAVQNIVADNDQTVKNAIAFLKRTNKGRATFLPITSVKGKYLPDNAAYILNEKGVISVAADVVKCDKKYRDIVLSLLGRVIIVDNIDNATMLAKKTNHSYKIVTLEGELFNVGGSVTGGSVSKKSGGLFSRTRELRELSEKAEQLQSSQNELLSASMALRRKSDSIAKENAETEQKLKENDLKEVSLNSFIKSSEEFINDIDKRIGEFNNEMEKYKNDISPILEKIEQNKIDLQKYEDEIEAAKTNLSEYNEKLESDKAVRNESLEAISSLQLEISRARDRITGFDESADRLAKRNGELEKLIKGCQDELSKNESAVTAYTNAVNRLKSRLTALTEENEKIIKEKDNLSAYKKDISKEMSEKEDNLTNINKNVTALEKKLTGYEFDKEKAETRCTDLYNKMWDEYEITYVMAKEYERLDIPDEELAKQQKQLSSSLKALGDINYASIEEYASTGERYEFLVKNRDDIIETENKLIKIISELKELMEKQFSEQFDVIRKNFSKTFSEMFGGGKGDLKLSDEGDVLGSGIDIIVQPPGKALQNMMLLSGGERAFVAIALLFAILKMKPSPFCVLDEVEAALDPSNVVKYAEYLKNFVKDTQFIIVTHRNGTMEAADILYGVTMQEQGVTKLVSVNIEDKKR